MKKTRLIAITLFLLAALTLCFLSAASPTDPVLYRNDTKYSTTEYPPEIVDGKVHVPASFFVGLNNVEYQFDKKNNSFYFRNNITGRFLSFSFNVSGIVVDGDFTSTVFPLLNSTVYMPLEYCAEVLSLKIEKSESDSIKRIRLSDGSEKLTFKELIELYDPVKEPDDPSVINPVDPEAPEDIEIDRYLYLTIEADETSNIDKMLDTLRDWGENATFFFTEEAIKKNPKSVIRAFTQNHGIGILSAPENIEKTNRALFEVVGFCSRLLRLTNETEDLSEKGYIVWGYTKESVLPNANTWTVAKDIYNSTFINDITVLRLNCEEYNVKVLTYILSLISDDKYIKASIIDPTTPEI